MIDIPIEHWVDIDPPLYFRDAEDGKLKIYTHAQRREVRTPDGKRQWQYRERQETGKEYADSQW